MSPPRNLTNNGAKGSGEKGGEQKCEGGEEGEVQIVGSF